MENIQLQHACSDVQSAIISMRKVGPWYTSQTAVTRSLPNAQ